MTAIMEEASNTSALNSNCQNALSWIELHILPYDTAVSPPFVPCPHAPSLRFPLNLVLLRRQSPK